MKNMQRKSDGKLSFSLRPRSPCKLTYSVAHPDSYQVLLAWEVQWRRMFLLEKGDLRPHKIASDH